MFEFNYSKFQGITIVSDDDEAHDHDDDRHGCIYQEHILEFKYPSL
jgi:hypothetical protein